MKQRKEIYEQAYREIQSRRQAAQMEYDRRQAEIRKAAPQAAALEKQMADAAFAYVRRALSQKGDRKALLDKLEAQSLSLQKSMEDALTEAGYPKNYLDVPYRCPICRDTGYDDEGRRCECFQKLVGELTAQEFSRLGELPPAGFSDFSLEYYPSGAPRRAMSRIFTFCRRYSEDFSLHSPSLLFMGATGLGKTHLSLAVARAVAEKGFCVFYASAPEIFASVQREYYGRGEGDISTMETLRGADLLVLDDLGSEYESAFHVSTLYTLLNARLERARPTIVSTNLSFQELEARYGDRVASRLMTLFTCFKFTGVDIRQQKLRETR